MIHLNRLSIMITRRCYLRGTANEKIELVHNELKILGRDPETKIQDPFLSKKQLECLANVEIGEVSVKPIGQTVSGIDGYAIVKDKVYKIGHGHKIEFRLGFHQYDVIFEPPLDDEKEDVAEPLTKKPKIDFPIFSKGKMKYDKMTFSDNGTWEDIDHKELIIYTHENIDGRSKIAAFDIDGTIIKTKSGARFPKDGDDWVLNYSDIPQQLKALYEDGYKIVFFTNQSAIFNDSFKTKDFKRKVENIVKKISLPIQVYAALAKTIYRKPAPGMWNVLKTKKNDGTEIDVNESFYVGDAAGREKNWAPKRNKDHSKADRLFALNIGLKFYTPEEYFLKAKPVPYSMPEFDPCDLAPASYPDVNFKAPSVILMVGGPGSGKSYFCRTLLLPKGYIHINRDTLGSWQKCVKMLEDSLDKKKNCVVDNTNPDREARARFIEVAKRFKVMCRCFVMSTEYQHMKHNNKFRELTDKSHVPVSEIIINSYKNKFEEPQISEGFQEIIKVPFVPVFDKEDDEKLYKMFLLEK
ncbi:unnamed protein product [Phaedon cochleariae]|uniref:PNK FHA domain-containing protein n=1 Tax=Phaedon cochleariae TaxID=80249 RepID=A0A9P0DQI2_PHACE|nr:unnamed protein product [Phaedon cochleariae]